MAMPTPDIYTLSLHDALPISGAAGLDIGGGAVRGDARVRAPPLRRAPARRHLLPHPRHDRQPAPARPAGRSEEHTSELQSHSDLVCRLLLEKKKINDRTAQHY